VRVVTARIALSLEGMMKFQLKHVRRASLCGASLLVLAFEPGTAMAQVTDKAPSGGAKAEAPAESIIVTGTRIQRDGYDAPTPVTVVNAAAIEKAAPTNVADFINQMPQLTGSSTPRVANGSTSFGISGLNLLNLRGLGSNRTLVLIDGQRVAPSTQDGSVDVNNVPSALLQRVDVVTGGASAAYGSDAIAGVVNFIIDEGFEGIKGTVLGGISDRNDNEEYLLSAAVGKRFASDRGRILFSVEHQHGNGIDYLDPAKRDWYNFSYYIPNPAYAPGNGQPQNIVSPNVYYNNVAKGGVITNTALAGTQFGAGGAPLPFDYGTIAGNFMIGGNPWNEGNVVALTPRINRTTLWSRLSYEFSPAIKATIEGAYGSTRTVGSAAYQRYPGNLTISADNPFLPQSIRDAAAEQGITQFSYGYSAYDLGRPVNDIKRTNYRLVGTLSGEMGGSWKWQAYYQYGRSDITVQLLNSTRRAAFAQAIDAVESNGKIICRSTLTDPDNGCQPLNIFGIGVASESAINYVNGTVWQDQKLTQKVAAASITGEPFDLWAGPVSIAAGIEHRSEYASAVGDPLSQVNGWYTGNFKTNEGGYKVTEGYLEVLLPLLDDSRLGKADFNGAVRLTDYSTSGTVTTWKAGLTYEPIPAIRLRAVFSRDIRAPSIAELYVAGATNAVDVIDPENGNNVYRVQQVRDGNLALRPEKADTLGVGIVFRPDFLPGFSASVDYYDITLNGAVTTLSVNEIASRCYQGETELCSFISRDSNNIITEIRTTPLNLAALKVRGLDIDATYRLPLDRLFDGVPGAVTLLFRANRALEYSFTNNGITNEAVGENGGPYASPAIPRWQTFSQIAYDDDRVNLTLTMRTISSGVYDNTFTSGVEIDDNHIDGATYFDLGGSYRLLGRDPDGIELFFKVDNLLDRDPPVIGLAFSSGLQTNAGLYDVIGRSYRVGLRFRY